MAAAAKLCSYCTTPCEDHDKFCSGCGVSVERIHDASDDPLIGQTLRGGLHVLELIGTGGMGRVFRAEQRMLGRTVAAS